MSVSGLSGLSGLRRLLLWLLWVGLAAPVLAATPGEVWLARAAGNGGAQPGLMDLLATQGADAALEDQRRRLQALLAAAPGLDDEVKARGFSVALARELGDFGALLFGREHFTAAGVAWRAARRLDKASALWPYWLYWLAVRESRFEDGLHLLVKSQAAAAVSADRRWRDFALFFLREGQVLQALGRLDEAQFSFEQATRMPLGQAAAWAGLGRLALLQGDDEQARLALDKALGLAPQASALYYPLGQALRRLGRIEEAKATLAKRGSVVVAVEDPWLARLALFADAAKRAFAAGMLALRHGDVRTALARFEEGLEHDPENSAARVSWARLLFLAGRQREARAVLDGVLRRQPGDVQARFFALLFDWSSLSPSARLQALQRLHQDAPEHLGAALLLANRLLLAGQYEKAALIYERLLEQEDVGRQFADPSLFVHALLAQSRAAWPVERLRHSVARALALFPGQEGLLQAKALLDQGDGLAEDLPLFQAWPPDQAVVVERVVANFPLARPF